jgi:hypothetical protein
MECGTLYMYWAISPISTAIRSWPLLPVAERKNNIVLKTGRYRCSSIKVCRTYIIFLNFYFKLTSYLWYIYIFFFLFYWCHLPWSSDNHFAQTWSVVRWQCRGGDVYYDRTRGYVFHIYLNIPERYLTIGFLFIWDRTVQNHFGSHYYYYYLLSFFSLLFRVLWHIAFSVPNVHQTIFFYKNITLNKVISCF